MSINLPRLRENRFRFTECCICLGFGHFALCDLGLLLNNAALFCLYFSNVRRKIGVGTSLLISPTPYFSVFSKPSTVRNNLGDTFTFGRSSSNRKYRHRKNEKVSRRLLRTIIPRLALLLIAGYEKTFIKVR